MRDSMRTITENGVEYINITHAWQELCNAAGLSPEEVDFYGFERSEDAPWPTRKLVPFTFVPDPSGGVHVELPPYVAEKGDDRDVLIDRIRCLQPYWIRHDIKATEPPCIIKLLPMDWQFLDFPHGPIVDGLISTMGHENQPNYIGAKGYLYLHLQDFCDLLGEYNKAADSRIEEKDVAELAAPKTINFKGKWRPLAAERLDELRRRGKLEGTDAQSLWSALRNNHVGKYKIAGDSDSSKRKPRKGYDNVLVDKGDNRGIAWSTFAEFAKRYNEYIEQQEST
jgi:hypothetical protein